MLPGAQIWAQISPDLSSVQGMSSCCGDTPQHAALLFILAFATLPGWQIRAMGMGPSILTTGLTTYCTRETQAVPWHCDLTGLCPAAHHNPASLLAWPWALEQCWPHGSLPLAPAAGVALDPSGV